MKLLKANEIAPDGTKRSAASHLELGCLAMSHKKDTRLKFFNRNKTFHVIEDCSDFVESGILRINSTVCFYCLIDYFNVFRYQDLFYFL